jgi:D-alanyl-D-alanine dipeptidase
MTISVSFATTHELVELIRLEPTLRLDICYARDDNFVGRPVYTQARAFLQAPAARDLIAVHRDLESHGYGLLIHDGYRPWSVTKIFWDVTPPEHRLFVADPARGSRHNRGCAVDLSLFERSTGLAATMPSAFDEFTERAYADYAHGTPEQTRLRDLLMTTMEAHHFRVNRHEWWHFDHDLWKSYGLLNIPFEDL